jgi:hypothetical protein
MQDACGNQQLHENFPSNILSYYEPQFDFPTIRPVSMRAGIVQSGGLGTRWSRNRGSIRGRTTVFFSSPRRPDRLWDSYSLLSSGYRRALPSGVKWPWHEAYCSLPSSAEVKNEWGCTSTSPYVFPVWFLLNSAQGQPRLTIPCS